MFWEQLNIKTHKQIALTSSQLINIIVIIYCYKMPKVIRNLRGSPQDLFIIFPSHISPGFTLAYYMCSVLPQQTQALSPHLADSLPFHLLLPFQVSCNAMLISTTWRYPSPKEFLWSSQRTTRSISIVAIFAFVSLMSLLSYNPQS